MVVPIYFSNTSELMSKLTDKEREMLNESLRQNIIKAKINKEYELFFNNLNNNKTPKFAIEFINKLTCEAIESKSLPSIVIAQAALETGYGKHNKLKNNLFGIKGRGIKAKTKEFYNGRFITITAEFQYFRTVKDAFDKHYQILNRYGVYGYDYKFWIDRIMNGGYATDPNYDYKLNNIIEKYELQILDKIQKLNLEYSNKCVTQMDFNRISRIWEY